jgi:hypothetical protein
MIEKIMESISSMSTEELRALLKYYESVEAYELCLNIKDLIKAEERESKLNELGI